jgi:hypothetical protein
MNNLICFVGGRIAHGGEMHVEGDFDRFAEGGFRFLCSFRCVCVVGGGGGFSLYEDFANFSEPHI